MRCILTAADLPQPVPRFGPVENDRPVLAVGETKYYGEPVAVVAADSEDVAREAADLVRVEYEELPGVYTARGRPGARRAPRAGPVAAAGGPVPPDQRLQGVALPVGRRRRGAAKADVVVEGTYRFPMQAHFAIEPHVFIAAPDAPDGLVIWSTVQHPFPVQRVVAGALGLPVAKVRVIATEMGGAFGGKGYPKFEPLMAFLALRTGRPVRLATSLAESFLMGRRASSAVTMRTGFGADGQLVFQTARPTT